jgi:hypothetical protein
VVGVGRPGWRWGVVAGLVAVLCALPSLVDALPARAGSTPAGVLLDRVRSSQDVAWSGLGESTGTLGLPDVRELSSLPALLGGTTRARVWWRGPTASRVDVLTPLGETDLVTDAAGSWTWDSEERRVTRLQGEPAVRLPRAADLVAPLLGRRLARTPGLTASALPARRVAGHDAAGLRLSPPAGTATTVAHLDLWVQPRTGLALRVEVVARGQRRPSLSSELLDLDLATPPLVRVAFAPPADAEVQAVDAPDLAAQLDRYAPYVLPGRLAGAPRRDRVDALRGASGVASYGEGLATFAVLPLTRDLGRRVLDQLDPTDTDGRADLVTPLVQGTVLRAGRRTWLVVGTVPLDVLHRAAQALADDPPTRVGG